MGGYCLKIDLQEKRNEGDEWIHSALVTTHKEDVVEWKGN